MIEFPEESQILDDKLMELLREAIPPANSKVRMATTATAGLDQEAIREAIEQIRQHKVPTWVVPVGIFVDCSIPVNVVHSPLVGPDYFVHIPVDAFDPWLD